MADPLKRSIEPVEPPGPSAGRHCRARRGAAGAPYLDGLNPEQRLAVETLDGPVLVLAGAGTGKTRVLTMRIAHILSLGRARPSEILAVTFTNKAAREMKHRVGEIVGSVVEGMPWLGTFHSIGVKILRRHAELVGLKSDFTILDVDDQIRLLKQLLDAEGIDEKRWPGRVLAMLIDGWKNRGLTPEQVPAGEAAVFANGKGLKLYKAYQERLKILNAADFGDLLLECIRLFREQPDVLRQYQGRFKYILVDEYQDTNVAQYLWLRLLAQRSSSSAATGTNAENTSPRARGEVERSEGEGASQLPERADTPPHPIPLPASGARELRAATVETSQSSAAQPKNICCVGDDDQSIYGWRGAEVDNILRFEHDFPGAMVIRLERNYRSTGHILAAASHLIAHNEGRLGKTLRTDDVPGEKVSVTGSWDSEEEARAIGEEIEQLQRQGRRQTARAQRDRHPGARLVPDARVRRPLRHARPALSRDRRPAVLRARRNPRCAGLSARGQFAGRRSRLRAHRQCAEARPRRRHRAAAARPRPQAPRAADRSGARRDRDRRAEAEAARRAARRARTRSTAGASSATPCRTTSSPKSSSTRAATPRCGRRTAPPTPPAGWRT